MHTHMYTQIHTHMHTQRHIYIYIYSHTHKHMEYTHKHAHIFCPTCDPGQASSQVLSNCPPIARRGYPVPVNVHTNARMQTWMHEDVNRFCRHIQLTTPRTYWGVSYLWWCTPPYASKFCVHEDIKLLKIMNVGNRTQARFACMRTWLWALHLKLLKIMNVGFLSTTLSLQEVRVLIFTDRMCLLFYTKKTTNSFFPFMNLLYFLNRWAVIRLDWRPFFL